MSETYPSPSKHARPTSTKQNTTEKTYQKTALEVSKHVRAAVSMCGTPALSADLWIPWYTVDEKTRVVHANAVFP